MVTAIKGNATSTFGGEIKTNNDSIISNRPIVSAKMSINQSINDNVDTKTQFDTVDVDTDSAFDTSAYRFTVPSGKSGKYMVSAGTYTGSSTSDAANVWLTVFKNGSAVKRSYINFFNSPATAASPTLSAVFDLNEGDFLEIYSRCNTVSGGVATISSGIYSWFDIHKLIG